MGTRVVRAEDQAPTQVNVERTVAGCPRPGSRPLPSRVKFSAPDLRDLVLAHRSTYTARADKGAVRGMSKKQRNLAPARATCVFCALMLSGKGAVVLSGARPRTRDLV